MIVYFETIYLLNSHFKISLSTEENSNESNKNYKVERERKVG